MCLQERGQGGLSRLKGAWVGQTERHSWGAPGFLELKLGGGGVGGVWFL